MNGVMCEKGDGKNGVRDEEKEKKGSKWERRCVVEEMFGLVEGGMKGCFVGRIGMMGGKGGKGVRKVVYKILRYVEMKI